MCWLSCCRAKSRCGTVSVVQSPTELTSASGACRGSLRMRVSAPSPIEVTLHQVSIMIGQRIQGIHHGKNGDLGRTDLTKPPTLAGMRTALEGSTLHRRTPCGDYANARPDDLQFGRSHRGPASIPVSPVGAWRRRLYPITLDAMLPTSAMTGVGDSILLGAWRKSGSGKCLCV
jgi:hypothetical protein